MNTDKPFSEDSPTDQSCLELLSIIIFKLLGLAIAVPAFCMMWFCSFRTRKPEDYVAIRKAHEKRVKRAATKSLSGKC